MVYNEMLPLRTLHHAPRPYLSPRFRQLRRVQHIAAYASQVASPAATPTFIARNRGRIAWISVALLLGAMGGNFVVHTFAPPPMPDAGTREDAILMADLNKRIDEEFTVKVLRGKCLGVAKMLKGTQGVWVEIVPISADFGVASNGEVEQASSGKKIIDSLAGAKGLGVERLFWDRNEHMLVAIVWFGGSLCGWPGVTHGGVIATQLAEKLALAASLTEHDPFLNMSAAAIPQRMPGTGEHAKSFSPSTPPAEPSQLSLSYVKPTYANDFYVIRVSPALPLEEDSEHIVPSEPVGGHEFEATLERLGGINTEKPLVKARARFEASSATERMGRQIKDASKGSYEAFREWMWPSRQKSSI